MAPSDDVLEVQHDDGVVGDLHRHQDRTLSMTYRDQWRARRAATPISLSLPLTQPTHAGQPIANVLWGLLPDNDRVIERWSRQFEVSPADVFGLLQHVGRDVAGAMRFVVPGESPPETLDSPQSIVDIERRIRSIREDATLWHAADHGERWSLAGAQGKFALRHDPISDTWFEPAGARPTTHIFKPAVTVLADHDVNEHLCLAAAAGAGLSAASSSVSQFGTERAIVVERYDRHWVDERLVRVHQEDFCQAMGVHPQRKYQSDGGPTPEALAAMLRLERPASADDNLFRFALALGFNWMIVGTDAHAKNFSLLLQGNTARLAPLYDVASGLLLGAHVRKLKLAMKVGGEYAPHKISRTNFARLAADFRLDATMLIDRLLRLAEQVPDALSEAANRPEIVALDSPTPALLTDAVAEWCRSCARTLQSSGD